MLTVGSAAAKKGEKGRGYIKAGELALHSEILIPVLILQGTGDGPVLWLNGAVHGDELNGFMATRRVAETTDPKELKGALICTPLSNPLAVQWRNKVGPYDLLDMDQQFPGDPGGLVSQQIAHHLFREIKEKANYLINFHTAGTYYYAPPYTVFKKVPGVKPEANERTEAFVKAFGLAVNCRMDLSSVKGELPGNAAGALDVSCVLNGIPAFMAEVGSGGKFEEGNIAAAERGIRNAMKYLGMIPGERELPKEPIVITQRSFLNSSKAGFWVTEAKAGTFISKGQTIGRIIDVFSEVEVIKAQRESYIIQERVNPVVHAGDRVAFLGLKWGPF